VELFIFAHHCRVAKCLERPLAYATNCLCRPNAIVSNENLFDSMITATVLNKLLHGFEEWLLRHGCFPRGNDERKKETLTTEEFTGNDMPTTPFVTASFLASYSPLNLYLTFTFPLGKHSDSDRQCNRELEEKKTKKSVIIRREMKVARIQCMATGMAITFPHNLNPTPINKAPRFGNMKSMDKFLHLWKNKKSLNIFLNVCTQTL